MWNVVVNLLRLLCSICSGESKLGEAKGWDDLREPLAKKKKFNGGAASSGDRKSGGGGGAGGKKSFKKTKH